MKKLHQFGPWPTSWQAAPMWQPSLATHNTQQQEEGGANELPFSKAEGCVAQPPLAKKLISVCPLAQWAV